MSEWQDWKDLYLIAYPIAFGVALGMAGVAALISWLVS